MDEIEFAQAVARALQKNTRDVVLHSMKTKGFSIDGFRNLEKVPVNVLINALKKTRIKGKQCNTIFLTEVKECKLDDVVIDIVRLWYGSENEKKEAVDRISELKVSQSAVEKGYELQESEEQSISKDFQPQYTNLETKLDEQRDKNKQLQGKIQSLKIQLENVQKEVNAGCKEKDLLKKENEKLKTEIDNLQKEIKDKKDSIEQAKVVIKEQKDKAEFYQHVLQRAPKILCFTKAKINEEEKLLYNLTVCRSLDSTKKLEWIQFNRIWIAENDFTLEQIQEIKEIATQKVNTARNIKSIIERLR